MPDHSKASRVHDALILAASPRLGDNQPRARHASAQRCRRAAAIATRGQGLMLPNLDGRHLIQSRQLLANSPDLLRIESATASITEAFKPRLECRDTHRSSRQKPQPEPGCELMHNLQTSHPGGRWAPFQPRPWFSLNPKVTFAARRAAQASSNLSKWPALSFRPSTLIRAAHFPWDLLQLTPRTPLVLFFGRGMFRAFSNRVTSRRLASRLSVLSPLMWSRKPRGHSPCASAQATRWARNVRLKMPPDR